MANIKTFADLGKKDDDEDKPRLFTGGIGPHGGGSGQAVFDDSAKKTMDRAKQLGATSADAHKEGGGPQAFHGAGYTMDGQTVQGGEIEDRGIKHTITFWKGGFSVDDGPFRESEDPASREFLEAIHEGRVPREFGNRPDTYVDLVDKSQEEFKQPPKVLAKFAGQGHSLGGAAAAEAGPVQKPGEVQVDPSQPVTTIRIRLHDGTTVTQQFNLTHTVNTVREFVSSATPGCAFDLMMTFPRKTLDSASQTIKEADLENAAIVQVLR